MNETPNVTRADVEACIVSEYYFNPAIAELSLLTFCALLARNGHIVVGESHCQNPAKFNAETGRIEARKDAISKLWPMMVYAARTGTPAANDPEYDTDTQDAS